MIRHPPRSPPFPHTPLSRSFGRGPPQGTPRSAGRAAPPHGSDPRRPRRIELLHPAHPAIGRKAVGAHWDIQGQHRPFHLSPGRSEEHTSELQSPCNLVCRLLLEKKKKETK